MIFKPILNYITLHRNWMILTGLLAISGTAITSYGYLNHITSLLILGPIVATSGKLLFFSVLFIPKIISIIRKKIRATSVE